MVMHVKPIGISELQRIKVEARMSRGAVGVPSRPRESGLEARWETGGHLVETREQLLVKQLKREDVLVIGDLDGVWAAFLDPLVVSSRFVIEPRDKQARA